MELLDLLERRVSDLLDEMALLRTENRRLKEELAAGQNRVEELAALQQRLEQERQAREQAATRVDTLLRRIQENLGENPGIGQA